MATTYKVTTSSGPLNVRSKPSTSGTVVGKIAKGTVCSGNASGGWVCFSNGPYSGKYASASYLTAVSSGSTGKTSATSISNSSGIENYDIASVPDNSDPVSALKREHYKSVHALGCPPMYNQYTDCQYINDVAPGVGRVFASTMLSNPTILSICPGKVDYLPGFNNKQKSEFLKYVTDLSKGTDIAGLINKNANTNGVNGKLFEFKAASRDYTNVVNMLCRMMAIYMGIGDKNYPQTNIKYKYFDYGYVTETDGATGSNTGSLFKDTVYSVKKALNTAVSDSNYIHFFVTHQGTSLSESITTNTTQSAIEGILGGDSGLSEAARNIQFLLGGTLSLDGINSDVSELLGNSDSWVTSFGSLAANYLKGGRLVFPQMISDVNYDKSFSCSCKFVSPYGDPESIFLRCYMPAMFLLAFALPKQISDNMYTYPFLVRAFQKGFFNSDLAIIQNLQMTRGGSDDTSWTSSGLSTEIEVRFDVTPLYSRLMSTSTQNPFLFLQNTALNEYLATIAGIDLKANNLQVKKQIATSLIKAVAPSTLSINVARGISDKLANSIAHLFQVDNM